MNKSLLLVILTISGSLAAQAVPNVQCNSLIALDAAHVIQNPAVVQRGAKRLIDLGADVHIITVNAPSLPALEAQLESQCPNWREATGRKRNLAVFMLDPSRHAKAVFLGDYYSQTFNNDGGMNSLYGTASNDYFHENQFDTAFASALNSFGSHVSEFQQMKARRAAQAATRATATPAYVPPQQTPQSSDGSAWVASFFKWLLLIVLIGGAIFGVFWWLRKRKQDQDDATTAQQSAVNAQSQAVELFNGLDKTKASYPSIASEFARLTDSISYDGTASGQSAATYRGIKTAWEGLTNRIEFQSGRRSVTPPPPTPSAPAPTTPSAAPHHHRAASASSYRAPVYNDPPPRYTEPNPYPVIIPVPIVEREVYREPEPPYREPEPSYRQPEPEPEPEPQQAVADEPESSYEPEPEPTVEASTPDEPESQYS